MDLAHPISSVIPSLDAHVLEALSRTSAPASLTKVHQRAGAGSLSGVRKVLERMVEHGLVRKDSAGYMLNRQHLAADAILQLAGLHGAFADRLRGWVNSRPEPIVAVGLYGSMARRDGTVDSDVDLVVVVEGDVPVQLRDEMTAAVQSWTGNEAQVVVLTQAAVQDLRQHNAPIVQSWRHELLMIVGEAGAVVG